MVAASKSILDARVLLDLRVINFQLDFFDICLFKVSNSILVPLRVELAETSPVISLRAIRVILDGIGKVLNGQLVISHVLVHNASGYIHCFVVVYFLDHFSKTFQSFLKFAGAMVHQAQVKTAAHKVLLER
jgi:hypothetical protein